MAKKPKIEYGFPIPDKKFGRPHVYIYPFDEMEIGNSFSIYTNGEDCRKVQARILQACRPDRMNGKRFTTRYIKEENCVRCWRFK